MSPGSGSPQQLGSTEVNSGELRSSPEARPLPQIPRSSRRSCAPRAESCAPRRAESCARAQARDVRTPSGMPSRTRNRYVTRTRPRVSDAALLPCAAPWLLTSCPWPLYMRVPALVALPMAPEAPPVLCGRPAAARACPCGVSRLLGPLGDLISAFPAPLMARIPDRPPPECSASGMILGCLATFSSVWRALGSWSAACD